MTTQKQFDDRFAQVHMLTSYPPSNLNRDDAGRPKTAVLGGTLRLRVSSQSLKRAWRTSDLFKEALPGKTGVLTRTLGLEIINTLKQGGVPDKAAEEWAVQIVGALEKKGGSADEEEDASEGDAPKKGKKREEGRDKKRKETAESGHLLKLGPAELEAVRKLAGGLAKGKAGPTDADLKKLDVHHGGIDIAMFGRMLADNTAKNVEAAVQVAHAITIHDVAVEDDYFTAVDDLNQDRDETGAGHVNEAQFGAGVFYTYACIDRALLLRNMQGDLAATKQGLATLLEAACCVSPRGKQNSFASRAYASYVLVEKGNRQPRSLSVAFLDPVRRGDHVAEGAKRLEATRLAMDRAYGECARESLALDVQGGKATLGDLKEFISR